MSHLPETLRSRKTPRRERVAEQLREEIALLMTREMKDPRVRLASISSVNVSPDLRQARVMVSAFGDDASRRAGQSVESNRWMIPKFEKMLSEAKRRYPAPSDIFESQSEAARFLREFTQ